MVNKKILPKDGNKTLSSKIQKNLTDSKFHYLSSNDLIDTNENPKPAWTQLKTNIP